MSWTIFYTMKQQEVTILRCFGSEPSLSLPDEIDGFPVTCLGPACFAEGTTLTEHANSLHLVNRIPPDEPPATGSKTLKRLTLPAPLRQIAPRSLAGCSALLRLELPPNVELLGAHAFDHCRALSRILLPSGLSMLPDYAFADCRSLESLTIPPSVTAIGSQCFYNCTSLQSMELPHALQTIGSGIFMNCSRLHALSVPFGINASVLLADLYQKLEVTVQLEHKNMRLLFPEYAYEFEDIVMPRQFRTITYGSGGRYRECIDGAFIDMELYDSLFRVAKLEESPETAALLALFRLMDPEELHPEAREEYRTYLRQNSAPLGKALIAGNREAELEFLLTHCAPEPKDLALLMEYARQHNHPRFVSRILDANGSAPAGADKAFDL